MNMTPSIGDYVRAKNGAYLQIKMTFDNGEVKVSTGKILRLKPDCVPAAQAGLPPYLRLWEIDEA